MPDEVTDTPTTISEAMEQASEKITSEEVAAESSPASEVEQVSQEQPVPEESQTEEVTKETPLDALSPDSYPPELRGAFEQMKKNFDKGFTQGRQKDREEITILRKELEELKASVSTQEAVEEQLTPEEYVDRLVDQKVTAKKIEDFRDTALKEYNEIDPRLNNSEGNESYDQIMDSVIGAQMDKLLDEHVQQNGSELGFDYKTHGKELVKQWDEYLRTHFEKKIKTQREIATKKSTGLRQLNPRGTTSEVKPSGAMSIESAVEAAWSKVNGS